MYQIKSFSSLLQATNAPLTNTAGSLLNGLKIRINQQWYICGTLALTEGSHPRRGLNIHPSATEYNLLFKAGLLVSGIKERKGLIVTIGFPNNTFRLFKDVAKKELTGIHPIEFDATVYGNESNQEINVHVEQVEVLPEIVGCMIALRKDQQAVTGSFFVLSFGFGTFETGLSTNEGVIENSLTSTMGLNYAVNLMREELLKTYNLEFKNVQQLDEAFKNGHIFINRKKVDIKSIRTEVLRTYYNEIISPALTHVINDKNLDRAYRVYLCGGGALYDDLIANFTEEFSDIVDIHIADEPDKLAVKGYLINSLRFTPNAPHFAVGLDLGNINTRAAVFSSIEKGE